MSDDPDPQLPSPTVDETPTDDQLTALQRLADTAQHEDGQPAFSDQTWVDLRQGNANLISIPAPHSAAQPELLGAAALTLPRAAEQSTLVELTVHPQHRRQGLGTDLVAALATHLRRQLPKTGSAETTEITAWAHGDHPAARILAERAQLTPVRQLWKMALPITEDSHWELEAPEGITIRDFVPGQDDAAWLTANAAAFANHPEQGKLTQSDLDARKAEEWFDPSGFFIAEHRDAPGVVAGFHWTKVPVADTDGEVYAVGVAPDHQGTGLGRTLTAVGLNHLVGLGLSRIVLYVDADNAAAVSLYRSLGFTVAEADVMFAGE